MEKIAAKHASQFPPIELFTVDELFGGWQKAQKRHFDDGGIFDQISPARTVFEGGRGAIELVSNFSYINLDSGTLTGGKFWRLRSRPITPAGRMANL